jgi:hypothetical protein
MPWCLERKGGSEDKTTGIFKHKVNKRPNKSSPCSSHLAHGGMFRFVLSNKGFRVGRFQRMARVRSCALKKSEVARQRMRAQDRQWPTFEFEICVFEFRLFVGHGNLIIHSLLHHYMITCKSLLLVVYHGNLIHSFFVTPLHDHLQISTTYSIYCIVG